MARLERSGIGRYDRKEAVMAVAILNTRFGTPRRTVGTLLERVEAEYREMPGLSLTLPQAQRLWTADRATCEEVFSRLLARRVLRETSAGRFVRA